MPKVLATPVIDSRIALFAGQATRLRHFSTVHKEVETGFREADRLIHYQLIMNV